MSSPGKFASIPCIVCHKPRRVRLLNGEPRNLHCRHCGGRPRILTVVNTTPPKPNEIRRGREIGKTNRVSELFIWRVCPHCNDGKWVGLRQGKAKRAICQQCHFKRQKGPNHPKWKGGRRKNKRGYIEVWLSPDDFFYSMRNRTGCVLEHRLVVAKALGRCLQPWEIVHHKKGYAKDDNRYPKTLQVVTDDRHNQITILENRIKYLEQRVALLEADNVLLRGGQKHDSQSRSSYPV